jgi:hypothetical protein
MNRRILHTAIASLLTSVAAANAKTIVVNTVNNADFSVGHTNLVYALQLLADGDTINFAIPGAGVHTIDTPPNGYPLITKNSITIDGYSQQQAGSMASPNTASLHEPNNAQLKICLSSTNGNALSMYSAVTNFTGFDYPDFGFADDEQAILGFFRATNAWVKGLAFLAAPTTSTTYEADGDCKTICFAMDASDVSDLRCQGFHVSGCWFGIDPTTRQVAYMPDGTTVATPAICIATYGTGTNGTPGAPNIRNNPGPGTIGVAAGSANPRAEFNVFVTGYGFDSQGGPLRVSGNFWGVLPDGVTLGDISVLNGGTQEGDAFVEFGGSHDILIGTDGDGVNDADEGNLFGAYQGGGLDIYYYGSQGTTVIAGNTFGVDIHGNTFNVGQVTKLVHHFNRDNGQVRFGSDFNGVSDTLEANTVADSQFFDNDTGQNTTAHWVSMRGNSLVNSFTPTLSRPPLGDGQSSGEGLETYRNFIDISGANGTLDIIPVIGTGTTTTTLTGTYGKRISPFMRVALDLYQADSSPGVTEGKKWLGSFEDNSAADSNPAEGAFTFNIASLGIAHGTVVTITATYIIDNVTITSVGRSGGSTTLTISGGAPPYNIYGATAVDGTYALVATTAGATANFAAPGNMSFYKVAYHPQVSSGSGQTSPFSDLFTIP